MSWIVIFLIIRNFNLELSYHFFLISSINSILLTIKSFGTDEYTVLISSKLKLKALPLIRSIFCLNLFISIFFYFLILFFLFFFNKNLFYDFIILGLNSIFLINTSVNYLIGTKKLKNSNIIIYFLFILFCILFFFVKKEDLLTIYIIYTLYNFLVFIYYILILKKLKFRLLHLLKLIKKSFFILLSNFLNLLSGRGSLIILDLFLSKYNISLFSFLTRLVEAGIMISNYLTKYFIFNLIKSSQIINYIFKNYLIYFLPTISSFLMIIYIYQLDLSNIYFSFEKIFILPLIAIYLCFLSLIENIIKFYSIDESLNTLHLKNVFFSNLIRLSLLILLTFLYGIKGSLIAYFLNFHFYYILSYFVNKNEIKK